MQKIIARFKEPSTYAGLASILASFGLFGLTEPGWQAVFGAVAAIAGAIAIVTRDPGSFE